MKLDAAFLFLPGQASDAPPLPPVLTPCLVKGEVPAGDDRWRRGRFPGASPTEAEAAVAANRLSERCGAWSAQAVRAGLAALRGQTLRFALIESGKHEGVTADYSPVERKIHDAIAIRAMIAQKEVDPQQFAMLTDHVELELSGRQRHGAQWTFAGGKRKPLPLTRDEAATDRLRKTAWLDTIAENAGRMDDGYGPCPPEPSR